MAILPARGGAYRKDDQEWRGQRGASRPTVPLIDAGRRGCKANSRAGTRGYASGGRYGDNSQRSPRGSYTELHRAADSPATTLATHAAKIYSQRMSLVVGVARAVLVLAFSLAAVGKLRNIGSFRAALHEFGLPDRISGVLQWLLPAFELGIAVGLLRSSSVRYAAGCSLVLLLLFIIVILRNLIAGRHPSCNCFGQRHSAPISWRTLVRNALLLTCAVILVIVDPSQYGLNLAGVNQWWQDHNLTILAVVVVAMVVQFWLILLLMAQRGQMLLRLERLEAASRSTAPPGPNPTSNDSKSLSSRLIIGTKAPEFALPDANGNVITLASLRAAHKPVLLVFTHPSCAPCMAVLPEIAARQWKPLNPQTIAVISQGPRPRNSTKDAIKLQNLLWQRDDEVSDAYGVRGTPTGILVSPDGLIASTPAAGAEPVRALLNRPAIPEAERRNDHLNGYPSSSGLGAALELKERPDSTMTLTEILGADAIDLGGTPASIAQDGIGRTMLLFWNPACGFCQQLVPDLRQIVREDELGNVGIVAVSRGTVEDNTPIAALFRTVLDQEGRIMQRAQVSGTPMAIMFDRSGIAVSTVAAGGPAVIALARSRADGVVAARQGGDP